MVRAVAQELVDEIAIGAVQLHAIEAGTDRIARGGRVIVLHTGDIIERRGARLAIGVRLLVIGRARRRGRQRRHADHVGARQAAHVPDLRDDLAARLMHRRGHRLPRLDLLVGPQARRIGPAQPFLADAGAFGDDEAGAGALAVIVDHDLGRHMAVGRAAAGQRRHEDAVGGVDVAQLDGVEKARHGCSVSGLTRGR